MSAARRAISWRKAILLNRSVLLSAWPRLFPWHGADVGPRTLEWHSVRVIDGSAVFRQQSMALAQTRDHASNRSGDRGALVETRHDRNRSVHGGPLTKRRRQRHRRCGRGTTVAVAQNLHIHAAERRIRGGGGKGLAFATATGSRSEPTRVLRCQRPLEGRTRRGAHPRKAAGHRHRRRRTVVFPNSSRRVTGPPSDSRTILALCRQALEDALREEFTTSNSPMNLAKVLRSPGRVAEPVGN